MPIPEKALELENEFRGPKGKPTLAEAQRLMREAWNAGNHERELGLHLMFATWMCLVEPLYLTGTDKVANTDENWVELQNAFKEVFDYFAPSIESDAEMLYVVGLMASLFPWALGEEAEWEETSEKFRKRYHELLPNGIDPDIFRDRSAFGDYFEHMAKENHHY